MTSVNIKQPTPVKIGPFTLYCEKMSLSAKTLIHLTPTVTGVPVKTNKCRQLTYLTFSGRVYDTERPMYLAAMMNNLNATEGIDLIYKGIKFAGCTVTGIKAEDAGKDYIDLTVTFATTGFGNIYSG